MDARNQQPVLRDPRLNPIPGDILRSKCVERLVLIRSGRHVIWEMRGAHGNLWCSRQRYAARVSDWCRLMRGTTVVELGDVTPMPR